MVKSLYKISILAWLVLLLIVFSCESEAEKKRAKVEMEIKLEREDSVRKAEETQIRMDSVGKLFIPKSDSFYAEKAKQYEREGKYNFVTPEGLRANDSLQQILQSFGGTILK
jgi:hypothetical protein